MVSRSADNSVLLWDWLKCARAKALTQEKANVEDSWKLLGSDNVADAYRALGFFVGIPKEATSFLGKKLRKGHPLKKEAFDQLVRDLDDSQFNIRDRADKELEKLGPAGEAFLRKALTDGKFSLEGRKRINRLLGLLKSPAPEWLRSYRAIQVLELIDLPQAARILQALSEDFLFDQGIRSVQQADTAKAALLRWQSRTFR